VAAETPSLDTIFCAAIKMASAEERAAYIAQACGDDHELQARVAKLVDAHFRAGSFLEEPAAAPGATASFVSSSPERSPLAEGPGTIIGPYKLLQQIGEGGMGAVFMAEQMQPVKRKVALKVIKPGMDSRQIIARFEAERQALALMDHPNIAKVLDAGATEAGRPYFVMELVKGAPLTKYCDEHKLTLRQRLELFTPVCQAVQHAHQKGIIHRDLKPSNVLIALYDGKPVPKVIDFGVAKATGQSLTENTLFTAFGSVVGTLEYMSPEQAQLNQLDIDTRSDIYSLGVLLYELLTGTTPLESKRLKAAAMLEVLRLIREEEAPRPSQRLSATEELPSVAANRGLEPKKLSGLVRGELDWVAMKCLEKDRNRRYDTAYSLAADLMRYLADEPVQACPPSMRYRFGKFARRNKGALLTAALVTSALLIGTAVSVWQAVRATRALDSERQTRAALDLQRTQINGKIGDALLETAELREKARAAGPADGDHWTKLQDAARRAETLAASELADPALAERVRGLLGQVGQDAVDRRMVARLEGIRFQTRARKLDQAPPFDAGAAFAAAFGEYGLPVSDLPVADAAARIGRSDIRADLLASLDAWADWDMRGAGTAWKKVLAVAQAADDDPWRRQTYEALLHSDRAALARLARQEDASQQRPAAVVLLCRALSPSVPLAPGQAPTEERQAADDLLRTARIWHPADPDIGHELQTRSPGQVGLDDAERDVRETIKLLTTKGADPAILAGAHFALGLRLLDKLDQEGTLAAFRNAVRLCPDRTEYRERLINCLLNWRRYDEEMAACSDWIQSGPQSPIPYIRRGGVYWSRQLFSLALADSIKATELAPRDASAWSQRAELHNALHQSQESMAAAAKAVEAAEQTGLDPSPFWRLRAYLNRCARKWDKAIQDDSRSLERHPTDVQYLTERARDYTELGEVEKALADCNQAIKNDGPSNGFGGLATRSYVYWKAGRWKEAFADSTELTHRRPSNVYCITDLAEQFLYCPDRTFRDPRRALELGKEAIRLLPKSPPAPYAWLVRRIVGLAHYRLGEWNEAVAVLTDIADHDNAESRFCLAMAHWQLGNKEEARKWYDRGAEAYGKYAKGYAALEAKAEADALLGLAPLKEPANKSGP
jgi:serine/threonine protein kinase/tetratricopeptide (TPR) repeat protein